MTVVQSSAIRDTVDMMEHIKELGKSLEEQ